MFDLEDAFRVYHIFIEFHECIYDVIFWGYAVFEEIFEIVFVFLDIIRVVESVWFVLEDVLRIACIAVEFGEDGLLFVLAFIFSVIAFALALLLGSFGVILNFWSFHTDS